MAASIEKTAGVPHSENSLDMFIAPGPQHILNTLKAIADPAPEFVADFPASIREARERLTKRLNMAAENDFYIEDDVLTVRTAAGILSTDPQGDFSEQAISPVDVISAQEAIILNFAYGGVKKDNLFALARDYPEMAAALQTIVSRDTTQLPKTIQGRAQDLVPRTQEILEFLEEESSQLEHAKVVIEN